MWTYDTIYTCSHKFILFWLSKRFHELFFVSGDLFRFLSCFCDICTSRGKSYTSLYWTLLASQTVCSPCRWALCVLSIFCFDERHFCLELYIYLATPNQQILFLCMYLDVVFSVWVQYLCWFYLKCCSVYGSVLSLYRLGLNIYLKCCL